MIRLDIAGDLVELTDAVAKLLRDAAAAAAARSSGRRDLSLLLDRALKTHRTVALRRAEVRELASLLDEQALAEQLAGLRAVLARHER